MNPTDQALDTARAVLAKCAANDPWFPKPIAATVLAWAEQFGATDLSRDDLLAGVTAAYGSNGSGFKPLPADITGAARKIRGDRREREYNERSRAEIDAKWAQIAAERVAEFAERKAIPALERAPRSAEMMRRRKPPPRPRAPVPPWPHVVTDNSDPLLCGACSIRELVDKHDIARGVCTPCWTNTMQPARQGVKP